MPRMTGLGSMDTTLRDELQQGSLAEIIHLEPGMLYHFPEEAGSCRARRDQRRSQISRPDRQNHAHPRG